MSKRFSLNKEDLKKIIIGASIAISGAMLTYLNMVVLNTDFGPYTPVVVAVWSIVINAVKKYVEGGQEVHMEVKSISPQEDLTNAP